MAPLDLSPTASPEQTPPAPPPRPPQQRVRQAARRLAGLTRRAPVTISLVILLWVIGVATGSVTRGPAPALRAVIGAGVPPLVAGHWWTLVSGALWCAGPIGYLTASALLLGLVAPAENRIGSRATAVLLVVCQAAGSGIGIGIVALTAASGGDWVRRLATDLAVGPSTAAVGVLLATSCPSVRCGAAASASCCSGSW